MIKRICEQLNYNNKNSLLFLTLQILLIFLICVIQVQTIALATELMPRPDIAEDKDLVRAIENSGEISIRTQNDDIHPTLQILKQGHVVHEITRHSYIKNQVGMKNVLWIMNELGE